MHLISTYMDTQLEAPLDQPDARPFTSRYMARSGMELPRNKGPIIVCQSVNPPHYSLALSGDSLLSDYEEVQRVIKILLTMYLRCIACFYRSIMVFIFLGTQQLVSYASTFLIHSQDTRSWHVRTS